MNNILFNILIFPRKDLCGEKLCTNRRKFFVKFVHFILKRKSLFPLQFAILLLVCGRGAGGMRTTAEHREITISINCCSLIREISPGFPFGLENLESCQGNVRELPTDWKNQGKSHKILENSGNFKQLLFVIFGDI